MGWACLNNHPVYISTRCWIFIYRVYLCIIWIMHLMPIYNIRICYKHYNNNIHNMYSPSQHVSFRVQFFFVHILLEYTYTIIICICILFTSNRVHVYTSHPFCYPRTYYNSLHSKLYSMFFIAVVYYNIIIL